MAHLSLSSFYKPIFVDVHNKEMTIAAPSERSMGYTPSHWDLAVAPTFSAGCFRSDPGLGAGSRLDLVLIYQSLASLALYILVMSSITNFRICFWTLVVASALSDTFFYVRDGRGRLPMSPYGILTLHACGNVFSKVEPFQVAHRLHIMPRRPCYTRHIPVDHIFFLRTVFHM